MKTDNSLKYYTLAVISLVIALFTSCNEPNDLGMNLLPSTDLIEINNIVEKNSISSYTYTEDAIRTDEATRSLLGIFDDPVFGRTTINFASQFRMQYTPNYGTNPEADSIMLYLYYRYIYGDSTTTQRINVYELNENLIVDTTSASGGTYDYPYYQNVDLKSMASSEKIGEIEFVPEIKQDSVYGDTLYQLLKIPLNISLADKLVNADSTHMVNNDQFLEFFKGLYFESEKDAGQGGAIISLEAAAGSNFQGSALLVYYNNAENKLKASPDTLYYPYVISKFSARVNSITHDYSGTSFYPNLNTETGNDSLIFLQSTGGLKSKILIDNLIQWRDSANTAINKAELIFQIDSVISEVDKYAPPSQLLLLAINEEGKEYIPIDYYFSPLFYNGRLNSQDYTYKFNITQHLQQIIDGETENYGFFLSTARKNSEANRVVIKGHNSHTGIRLIITYSKFLQ